jgi:hypothetical protein
VVFDPTESRIGETSRTPLEPPRFGLRTLFWVITAFGISVTVWQAVGPIVGTMLFMIAMAVIAHVAGNAIGCRLRDGPISGRPAQDLPAGAVAKVSERPAGMQTTAPQCAPVTHLSRHVPLGSIQVLMTSLGVLVGTASGWVLFARLYPATATLPVLLVGSLATGAIGGFFAYWLFSLVYVLAGACWQAHCHADAQRAEPRTVDEPTIDCELRR